MKKLFMTNGKEIVVEDFVPKSKNFIKVRIHINDELCEGIWAGVGI